MDNEILKKEIKNLDKNIENLIIDCMDNELDDKKIYKLINENILKKSKRKLNKLNQVKNILNLIKYLILILITSFILTRNQLTNDLLKMFGRKMLINIKPYFNWIEYYNTNCFIKNIKFNNNLSTNINCNLCESVINFELIDNQLDLNKLTEFINNDRPIFISNRLINRPIFNYTLDQLAKFYLNLDFNDKICMFESSVNVENLFNLMSKLNKLNLSFYSQWENCGYSLRKKLRKLYDLPYMPMMLEFSRENWFLLSIGGYKSKNFKKIDIASGTRLGVFVQINGSNNIKLKPKINCLNYGCNEIEDKINENDLVIFSTTLYDLEYLPNSKTKLNLALLLGAIY